MSKYPVIIVLVTLVFYAGYVKTDTIVNVTKDIPEIKNLPSLINAELRDTVYTLKSTFIEVNLATQTGYLYSKGDSVFKFGVSTGNKKIFESIDTKEGLYVIQSKMPKVHSQQFDSTLLINWMGFNYGIGFHALAGNSYYKYLGVDKRSHGCVRISREDAKYIYSKIEIGTPILIHSGNNAVYIGFADSTYANNFSEYSYDELNKILPERFNTLYEGKYFVKLLNKILIGKNNITHNGLSIGDSNRIPEKQFVVPGSFNTYYALQDGVYVKAYWKG